MTELTQFHTPISLDRDVFMRRLIASLGHLNEGILGSDITSAYIINVGLSMGAAIEEEYKRFWQIERPFTLEEYVHVIIDLKQKINGNFSLVECEPTRVVVRTTSCPFDEFVRQSPSLCFMTSSVFGGIAARNFGYGKVVLHQRIALGDPGCYVTVHLQKTPEAEAAVGKEYVPTLDQASPDIAQQLRLMDHVVQLRRQLGESTSRWEEVLEGAADAIGVIDIAGRVMYANTHWRELLGFEGDELVGNLFTRAVAHPDEQQQVQQLFERVLHGERVRCSELRLKHRNATWRDVNVSGGPIRDDRGQIVGILSIFHDVTQEREAQRLKDMLVTTTSHELRTPTTTIHGLAELLLCQIEDGEPPDIARLTRHLQTIVREANRLTLLSNDLVDVARLQGGSVGIKRQRQDLGEVMRTCVERQREVSSTKRGCTLTLETTAAEFPVMIERNRLERVFSNLLENAIKYSPDGGDVNVCVKHDEQQVQVAITDHGIGIPQHDLPQLFKPFYRASNASTQRFMGIGLGLYLSRGVIEAHDGTISVQSIEGEGSTFVIILPLALDGAEGKQ